MNGDIIDPAISYDRLSCHTCIIFEMSYIKVFSLSDILDDTNNVAI